MTARATRSSFLVAGLVLQQSITPGPLRQETPQLAEWYRGKLHHMIAMRKILTTHYPTAESAAVSTHATHTHTHTRNHLRIQKYLNKVLHTPTQVLLNRIKSGAESP